MIVISGALVLVALVLLVLGLTMQDLNFVYGSIGVSLVSFVFLVIGILQRRGDQPQPAAGPDVREDSAPAAAASSAETAPVAVPAARSSSRRVSAPVVEEELEDAPEVDEDEEVGGTVLVVPGRPRYHVEGCRYLTGKEVDEVDVLDAREDGFTACGVCKPDAVLEALSAEPVAEIVLVGEEEVEDTGVPGTEEEEVEPAPAPAPAKARSRGSRKVTEAAPAAAPARKAPAKKAPAKKAAAVPAQPAAAQEPAADAVPAKAARRGSRVVVIPDRGRFHTADCRFVRGVAGTEDLTKAQATRQGYQPCGVCKPA